MFITIKTRLKKLFKYVKKNKKRCLLNTISISVLLVLNPPIGYFLLGWVLSEILYGIVIDDLNDNFDRMVNEIERLENENN